MLTARQGRGSQCHTVVCCLFRRFAADTGYVAHAQDPGKAAVMISRATHELILLHEKVDRQDFLSNLQWHLWHARSKTGYIYEEVDIDAKWTEADMTAWAWENGKAWRATVPESDSEDEDLDFTEIFQNASMRSLCELRDAERQDRTRSLPYYRRAQSVPWELWDHVKGLVFAKAVRAKAAEDTDATGAEDGGNVSGVVSLPMMPHNVSLYPGFQTSQDMWDSVPTALAMHWLPLAKQQHFGQVSQGRGDFSWAAHPSFTALQVLEARSGSVLG